MLVRVQPKQEGIHSTKRSKVLMVKGDADKFGQVKDSKLDPIPFDNCYPILYSSRIDSS
jgi:hypothetical protein